ncbi:MAG: YigZ family protein [Clostridia bacterium]|nr:YigZ family protein [Clostridia bacterium]
MKILQWYKTVAESGFFVETEKRSKFISFVFFVENKDQVQNYLKEVKAKYHDAKHHVYAYKLEKNNLEKFSDDGEPSGTAGMPLLGVISSYELSNVLVIVVRYFGGILLGTSGLRKMYISGGCGAIENAKIEKRVLCNSIELKMNYSEYSKVLNAIKKCGGTIINTDYEDDIKLIFYIEKDKTNDILKKISDIKNGDNDFKIISEDFMSVPD